MLAQGIPVTTAVAANGINVATHTKWMMRGKVASRGDAEFVAYRAAVKRAIAKGEASLVTMIRAAAPITWTAAAWLLERRFPERYARRSVPVAQAAPFAAPAPGIAPNEHDEAGDLEKAAAEVRANYWAAQRKAAEAPPVVEAPAEDDEDDEEPEEEPTEGGDES